MGAGLLSNYGAMIRAIIIQKDLMEMEEESFLNRQQLTKINSTFLTVFSTATSLVKSRRPPKYLRYPGISFSTLDDAIWLNECTSLEYLPYNCVIHKASSIKLPTLYHKSTFNVFYLVYNYLAVEASNTVY